MSRYDPRDNPHFARDVSAVVERHHLQSPHFRLIDLYKSFFQDLFGPGHLLDDPAHARTYLQEELATMRNAEHRAIEPCGFGENFCRVPLDLIIDEVVDKERFIAHFIASARAYALPSIREWERQWSLIVQEVSRNKSLIKGFDEDVLRIETLLGSGRYVAHHSEEYREAHQPHYRIFSLEQAKLLLSGYRG